MRIVFAILIGLAAGCPAVAAEPDPLSVLEPGSGQSVRDRLADGSECTFCPEMVVVPSGEFVMGSPEDEPGREPILKGTEEQKPQKIERPFAVGKFAITFAEWDACADDGGCDRHLPDDSGWGRGTQPVINLNWYYVKAYTVWLTRKTGKSYRLLTEAEWEYAARAGTTTAFWWGSTISPHQANYDGSAEPYEDGGDIGEYRQRTVPVDSFDPNPWGLYQMNGNVFEWTEECDTVKTKTPDSSAIRPAGDCNAHIIRGGAWSSPPNFLRSGFHVGSTVDSWGDLLGFRVARELEP